MSAISVSWLNVSWGAVYIETNYGLMQHSYIEIKNKLLRALDAEYNIVDMATVFEVVDVLERTPITAEILETTRLGKLINECRRRTNNEALAKRAKHLLRHWRNLMITITSEKSNSNVLSPSASTAAALPQQNGTNIRSSSHLKTERVTTPSISPALSTKNTSPMAGEPPAKASKMNGAMFSERCAIVSEDSIDSVCSRVCEPMLVTEDDVDVTSPAASGQTVVTESVPEPDPPLPKKRSRKKGNKKKSQADDIVKEKLVALSKTGRVKTTEELVAELKSRTVSTDDSVGRISVKPSLSNSVSTSENAFDTKAHEEEKLDPETRVEREIANILSKLPPINVDQIVWDSPEPSAPPTPRPITEEEVDRYLRGEWEGVNGCVTNQVVNTKDEDAAQQNASSFRGWHEMVARRTANDDLIHILPYSIVD